MASTFANKIIKFAILLDNIKLPENDMYLILQHFQRELALAFARFRDLVVNERKNVLSISQRQDL